MNPLYVLLTGIAALILLLNERARFAAALLIFLVVAIAAAQLMGLRLTF
jgi:hypothetical protein